MLSSSVAGHRSDPRRRRRRLQLCRAQPSRGRQATSRQQRRRFLVPQLSWRKSGLECDSVKAVRIPALHQKVCVWKISRVLLSLKSVQILGRPTSFPGKSFWCRVSVRVFGVGGTGGRGLCLRPRQGESRLQAGGGGCRGRRGRQALGSGAKQPPRGCVVPV